MKQHSSKKGHGLAEVFSFINPAGTRTMTSWLKEETFLSGANLAGFAHMRQHLDMVAPADDLKTLLDTRITRTAC